MAKSRIMCKGIMKEYHNDMLECIVDAMCAAVKVTAMAAVVYVAFNMVTPLPDSKSYGSPDFATSQTEAPLQYKKNGSGSDSKSTEYKQNFP